MSSDIAIQVSNLSKCYQIYDKPRDRLLQMLSRGRKQYYREFWAIKDVSFEVKKGETVGIIGKNGSGKSTLLQMICGTLNPSSGSIKTEGRIAALLELGSGFNPEFTGRENVYLNASVLGLNKYDIDQRFDNIAKFADIGNFINQPVKTYSSGMMVRLAFAVIAHVDADILIIDEALAVGDAFFTQKCMAFLRNFMKNGTILFVSHDTNSVKNLCNHAIWLDKGELLHLGSPKRVCEFYLESLYQVVSDNSNSIKQTNFEKLLAPNVTYDQRLKYLNYSNLRNDIQVFKFNPDESSFGKGEAQICNVSLLNEDEYPLAWIVGGETVILRVTAKKSSSLLNPIIGFFVKDRLGQAIFGDNTFITYSMEPIDFTIASYLQADFVFHMPLLPAGDYSVTVAIANGSQDEHDVHHWIHDAIIFKSESSSVTTGLVGIPMHQIKLKSLELIE